MNLDNMTESKCEKICAVTVLGIIWIAVCGLYIGVNVIEQQSYCLQGNCTNLKYDQSKRMCTYSFIDNNNNNKYGEYICMNPKIIKNKMEECEIGKSYECMTNRINYGDNCIHNECHPPISVIFASVIIILGTGLLIIIMHYVLDINIKYYCDKIYCMLPKKRNKYEPIN